jgi:hypothetical protein
MQSLTRRIPSGLLFLALVQLANGAAAQPQSPEQQRCITALNGGFAKVARTASQALVRCTKAAQKGDDFDACLGEQQEKLDKVLAKLESTESRKCSAAPEFGPNDLIALGDAGRDLASDAATDLFGPAPAGVLADKKAAKDTARCQLGVAKAAQKCALARVQAFNRCKKAGLKSGSITSAAELATCLDDDAGGKLAKACTAKLEKAAGRCAGVDFTLAFPACGASDAPGVAACADGRLACAAGEALAAADVFTAPSCGLSISPSADAARTAAADIGPEGGQVEAVGADGTVYRLTVPEGALASQESISLTPVTEIADLPLPGDLLAAVEFAPDGLQLLTGAVLEIELPGVPALGADVLVGIAWQGAGESFHLVPAGANAAAVTLSVTHFSGVGVVLTGPAVAAQLAPLVGAGGVSFQTQLAGLVGSSTQPGAFAAVLTAWYDTSVKPKLQAAPADDPSLQAALVDLISWLEAVETIPLLMNFVPESFLGLNGFALANRIEEAEVLVAAALRAGVERSNEACASEQSLGHAEVVMFWQAAARALDVATAQAQLDFETVLAELCIELLYDELTYPQAPPLGVPSQLHVSVGHSFDGTTIVFTEDADIIVEAVGADPGGDIGVAFEGSYFENFAPTGETELALRIEACLLTPDHPILSGIVCQTALVVRGLTLTPPSAALATGGQVDFDALLFGAPHPGVTWTASGGTIDSDGVFTAGNTEGTFSVTATSTTSGISASASVTVGTGGGGGDIVLLDVHHDAHASAPCQPPDSDTSGEIASSTLHASNSGGCEAGGSGSADADSDFTLGGSGDTVTLTHSGNASGSASTGDAQGVIVASGSARLDVEFEIGEGGAAYSFEVTSSLVDEGGNTDVSLYREVVGGERVYWRPNASIGGIPDPVGEDQGVLQPGGYFLRAVVGAQGQNGSSSAEGSMMLTLTPQ